jgi:molybdopterin-synthase adenylyltransferase
LTMPSKNDNVNNDHAGQEFLKRFSRQTAFSEFGVEGQRRLSDGGALVVGVGGLGSWSAEFLVRTGIGRIRLSDADCVELSNIHRQALYTERDAAERRLKVEAAAGRLHAINSQCRIETFPERIDRLTIHRAADGMNIILDGTDNFETRFLINDFAVKNAVPWIFAGVIGAEGQVMSVLPGTTPCLRCVMPTAPACSGDQNDCRRFGVIGAAVPLISAMQAIEAIKILSGHSDKANPRLIKFDLWNNRCHMIDVSKNKTDSPCPCCGQRDFIYLEP